MLYLNYKEKQEKRKTKMEIKGIKLTVKDYSATVTQTPALVDLGLILEITTADGTVIQKSLLWRGMNMMLQTSLSLLNYNGKIYSRLQSLD